MDKFKQLVEKWVKKARPYCEHDCHKIFINKFAQFLDEREDTERKKESLWCDCGKSREECYASSASKREDKECKHEWGLFTNDGKYLKHKCDLCGKIKEIIEPQQPKEQKNKECNFGCEDKVYGVNFTCPIHNTPQPDKKLKEECNNCSDFKPSKEAIAPKGPSRYCPICGRDLFPKSKKIEKITGDIVPPKYSRESTGTVIRKINEIIDRLNENKQPTNPNQTKVNNKV